MIKRTAQTLIVISETLIICSVFLILSEQLRPFSDTLNVIERLALFVVFYQVLVHVFSHNFMDAVRDQILAQISLTKLCLLYTETHSPELKCLIIKTCDELLTDKYLLDKESTAYIEQLHLLITTETEFDKTNLKTRLILLEQSYEHEALAWKHSIFLKFLK